MVSYQLNSQNNATTQNPTEHQTASAIQTGRENMQFHVCVYERRI